MSRKFDLDEMNPFCLRAIEAADLLIGMWQFLFRSAVFTVLVAGAKKAYDYVSSGPYVLTVINIKNGHIEVEGDSISGKVLAGCRDVCTDCGVKTATIRILSDGKFEFSGNVPAATRQRFRNALVG